MAWAVTTAGTTTGTTWTDNTSGTADWLYVDGNTWGDGSWDSPFIPFIQPAPSPDEVKCGFCGTRQTLPEEGAVRCPACGGDPKHGAD